MTLDRLVQATAKLLKMSQSIRNMTKPDEDLTFEEKQVLHYAASYVPRQLMRPYQRAPGNTTFQLFCDIPIENYP